MEKAVATPAAWADDLGHRDEDKVMYLSAALGRFLTD